MPPACLWRRSITKETLMGRGKTAGSRGPPAGPRVQITVASSDRACIVAQGLTEGLRTEPNDSGFQRHHASVNHLTTTLARSSKCAQHHGGQD